MNACRLIRTLLVTMAIVVVGGSQALAQHKMASGPIPGLPTHIGKNYNLPPAQQLLEPGPGVGGPGPGVIPPMSSMPMHMAMAMPIPHVQILFSRPETMQVRWDVSGYGQFDSIPLIVPGRHNFPQGGIYRIKLTNIPGREGVELYPTIEVAPMVPRTAAYLAHAAIPVQFTEEDFDQVLTGNFVTKVIYLPDPEFQELALAGVETLVSTRLDPGVDPIVEADRRGAIMAIIRMGNKDIEAAGLAGIGGMGSGFEGGMPLGVPCGPDGAPIGLPPGHVAGVTTSPWGLPMSGTPIGLPGPPHIPLGGPAGLQKHVMYNHTQFNIPGPTEKLKLHVKQQPGFSYPRPASHAYIKEQTIHPAPNYHQPHGNKREYIQSPDAYSPLPPGGVPGMYGAPAGTHAAGKHGHGPGGHCPDCR
jgi:hypothetical protein